MSAQNTPMEYSVYPCSYAPGWCLETLGRDGIWQWVGRFDTKCAALAKAGAA